MTGRRANSEGSIYERFNKAGKSLGWAAYVWVSRPDGTKARKYVYGQTRDEVHPRWIALHTQAAAGPVAQRQTISAYGRYWLAELVKPQLSPGTYDVYSGWFRRQIDPGIGTWDFRVPVRKLQTWFNKVATTCQCCFQGKDARRPVKQQRCCAVGKCCNDLYSKGSMAGLRRALRAMWTCAIIDELATKNVASLVKLPKKRVAKIARRRRRWSSDDARKFLESAKADGDRFYSVYTDILVLGLRKGEALGIDESEVDVEAGELELGHQLQRTGSGLLLRETKTADSEAVIPLPDICVAAKRWRLKEKARERGAAGDAWRGSTLVMTTELGTPVEPKALDRAWYERCDAAGVPRITRHDARRTCASLLADLGVDPRVAMRILRHSKFAMTMEVYTEVSPESIRAALRQLGEELT